VMPMSGHFRRPPVGGVRGGTAVWTWSGPLLMLRGRNAEHLPSAHGRAEQRLNDVADLAIALMPGQLWGGAPYRCRRADRRADLPGPGRRGTRTSGRLIPRQLDQGKPD